LLQPFKGFPISKAVKPWMNCKERDTAQKPGKQLIGFSRTEKNANRHGFTTEMNL
jgi:hypothetical protein